MPCVSFRQKGRTQLRYRGQCNGMKRNIDAAEEEVAKNEYSTPWGWEIELEAVGGD